MLKSSMLWPPVFYLVAISSCLWIYTLQESIGFIAFGLQPIYTPFFSFCGLSLLCEAKTFLVVGMWFAIVVGFGKLCACIAIGGGLSTRLLDILKSGNLLSVVFNIQHGCFCNKIYTILRVSCIDILYWNLFAGSHLRLHSSIVKKSIPAVFEGCGFKRVSPMVNVWVLSLLVSGFSIGETMILEALLASSLAMQSLFKGCCCF